MKAVTGTFGATGQSTILQAKTVFTDKTGGATATVAVEFRIPGQTTWYEHTAALADGAETWINLGAQVEWRLNCNAYTSGTVTYILAGEPY